MSEEKNMAEVKTTAKAVEDKKKNGWPGPACGAGPA